MTRFRVTPGTPEEEEAMRRAQLRGDPPPYVDPGPPPAPPPTPEQSAAIPPNPYVAPPAAPQAAQEPRIEPNPYGAGTGAPASPPMRPRSAGPYGAGSPPGAGPPPSQPVAAPPAPAPAEPAGPRQARTPQNEQMFRAFMRVLAGTAAGMTPNRKFDPTPFDNADRAAEQSRLGRQKRYDSVYDKFQADKAAKASAKAAGDAKFQDYLTGRKDKAADRDEGRTYSEGQAGVARQDKIDAEVRAGVEDRSLYDYKKEAELAKARAQGGIRDRAPAAEGATRDAGGNIVPGSQSEALAAAHEYSALRYGLIADRPEDDTPEQSRFRGLIGQLRAGKADRSSEARRLETIISKRINDEAADDPQKYIIPGWGRSGEAPEMGASEIAKFRKLSASMSKMRAISRKVQELDRTMTTQERALAAAGIDSPKTALAMQLQKAATTELRIIANMGVPSLAEMALVNQQAPELTTLSGWVNGATRFEAMTQGMEMTVGQEMAQGGWSRTKASPDAAPAPAAAAPTSAKRRYTINGKERDVTDDVAERLRSKGFTVEAVK